MHALLSQKQKDCPNGQLTRQKFLEVYSSFFPQGEADKFCEHVFRTFDADNSGKIDFKVVAVQFYLLCFQILIVFYYLLRKVEFILMTSII